MKISFAEIWEFILHVMYILYHNYNLYYMLFTNYLHIISYTKDKIIKSLRADSKGEPCLIQI